jgi:sugar lactone lactonase YvrE
MRIKAWMLVFVAAAGLPATAGAPPQQIGALAPFEVVGAGFEDVRGIAIDAAGGVIVADHPRGAVTRIATDSTRRLIATRLHGPLGIALDASGRVLVAEEHGGRVLRQEPGGAWTTLLSGVKQPRWIAVGDDDTIFVSVRRLTRHSPLDQDDDDAEPELIIAIRAGHPRVFVGSLRRVEGIVAGTDALYVATRARRGGLHFHGSVLRIEFREDGTAGAVTPVGPGDRYEVPAGLARDALGNVWAASRRMRAIGPATDVIVKLRPDGTATRFAANLRDPQGLAFGADGDLFVTDGVGGRVLRFAAPAPPDLTVPTFTNQPALEVSGRAERGARVDIFVHDIELSSVAVADVAGRFSTVVPLTVNRLNVLEAFATARGGDGLTSSARAVATTHDGVAPTLVFQAPSTGAHVRQTVAVQAHGSDSVSSIAAFAVTADKQNLPGLSTAPALPASNVVTATTWDTIGVADGSHTLSASAVDRAGNVASAATIVTVDNTAPEVQIVSGPSGTVAARTATFTFAGSDNLTAVTSVEFAWRLDDTAFSAYSGSTSVTVTGLTDGAHAFEVRARDRAGNESGTTARRAFTVGSPLTVAVVAPASGATVPEGLLVVRGVVASGGRPVAVAINGVVAAVDGTLFAAQVPVRSGAQELVATATSADGDTAGARVVVTVSTAIPAGPTLGASPASGVAPLSVQFVLNGWRAASIELDIDGDGVVDFGGASLEDRRFTYARPGLYFPTAVVTDAHGSRATAQAVVLVDSAATVTARFQGLWADFKSKLITGDTQAALAQLAPTIRSRFADVFQALGPNVTSVAGDLENLAVVEQLDGLAETVVVRQEGGRPTLYFIYFRRDSLGRWLIEEM